jgi:nucleotide-binding universal stress UspA family protein
MGRETDGFRNRNKTMTPPFQTILCPVELDKRAIGIANQVKRFAFRETTVFLLHLVTANGDSPDQYEHAVDELTRLAGEHLCPPDYRVVIRHASRSFRANVVIETAEVINADLIVMTDHGPGGFIGLFRENLAAEVIHRAPCPVLVIDPTAPQHVSTGERAGLVPETGRDGKILRWQR